MDQFQQKKRSSKPYDGSSGKISSLFDLKSAATNILPMDRAYEEGNEHMEKQVNSVKKLDSSFGSRLPAKENSFSIEFRRNSSSKGSGTPMKMLRTKEMSKQMGLRRRKPNIIARLMGLDALPTPHSVHKQQKLYKSYFQRTRSVGFKNKYVTHEDSPFFKKSKEQQEFKDVFEVMEIPKVEKHNIYPVQKAMMSSKLSEAKMAFIRKKFMDAKCLSTAENLHQSEEFYGVGEVLDSNKDHFLKFLEDPDSLFTKHLHDLQAVPTSPQSCDKTALKSTKDAKNDNNNIYLKSERMMEGRKQVQKDIMGLFQKQEHGCLSHNKHDFYISHKLSKSQFEGNTETYLLPTRIVILKPSHEMAHDTSISVSSPSSSGNFHHSHRTHRELPRSRKWELFPKLRGQLKSVNNVDFLRHKPNVSREIARKVTRPRQSISSDSNVSTLALKGYSGDESSDSMSGKNSKKDSEALSLSSRHFYDLSSRCNPSSSYSAKSSVSREAKKPLSERWKTQKFQEVGLGGKGSSTLGEMLALPDRERSLTALDSMIAHVGSSDRSSVNEVVERWDCPLGISSKDGWKDGSLRNLPRSRSLPTSSMVYQSPKTRSRHSALGSDDCPMLKEVINMGPDRPFNEESDQKEASYSVKLGVASGVGDARKLSDHASVAECQDTNMTPKTHEEPLLQPTACITLLSVGDSTLCGGDHDDVMKETLHNLLQVEYHGNVTEPESTRSSNEAERPSSISVLEPPCEAELSSSERFERVSAGLHGLRMQKHPLEFPVAPTDGLTKAPTDGLNAIVLRDRDHGDGCDGLLEDRRVISGLFRHVEDREFSFLLDMLLDSGFHGADHEMHFATSYSLEFPVASCVFDNLEKKYAEQLAWPRWERKLLFDCINSELAEILKPHMDLHPWVKQKERSVGIVWGGNGLADQVWQLLVKHGEKGLVGSEDEVMGRDVGWLELGDDIDIIGREIERALTDELMEVSFGFSSWGES